MGRCYVGERVYRIYVLRYLLYCSCVSSMVDVLFANVIYRYINNLPHSVERARSSYQGSDASAMVQCVLTWQVCVLQTARDA